MIHLYAVLMPAIVYAGAVVVILVDAFSKNSARRTYAISAGTFVVAIAVSFLLWDKQAHAFNGMVVLDNFSLVGSLLFCIAGLVTILTSRDRAEATSQFHCLVLLTVIGMIFLVAGNHFLILFIGLEVLSLSIYVLASFAKRDPLSSESGMKYFLLGSFASAFFLYGAAFIYGATGTLQLQRIAEALVAPEFEGRVWLLLGVTFLTVGYGFKISVAPFHMWTPDVYQGAPTPVTGFMAATVKAAALASLVRVLLVALPSISEFWMPLIWVLSVVTMIFGNLTAIWQDNLKRMLAYSSIAHAGYMLVGLMAEPQQAQQTILYYFAVYVFMNLGAFALLSYMENQEAILEVGQYQGLGYRRPVIATCMTLFLISLGGLPPTAGFFGKFYLFRAALQSGYVWLVVIAVLNSAVSFYYYLRVVISMFTAEKEVAPTPSRVSLPLIVTLAVTVWGTIMLGLFPDFFLQLARSVSLVS